ncbi:hypothetical protein F4859DRAFT_499545 [Xylaria cf. heliscus]|nr:hypothetical protein F4859DRAFT_499545 [Xylaria cf. heliscus]
MSDQDQTSNLTAILEGPALDPPPGVIPNFSNPGGSHSLGYAVCILTGALATLAVLLRLGSRYAMKKIQIEDVFLVSALGLFAGLLYANYAGAVSPGVEVHQWNVQFKYLERWLYLLHLASIFYGLTLMFLKLAILVDWLRLFVPLGQRNAIFWTIHILIWSNIIYYVSGTFLEIFRCTPRQKIWDPLFEGGICPIDINANNFASTIINLASDLAILAVPQWIIWRLQMSTAKRVGISLLFVIGLFAVVAGVFRLVLLLKILDNSDTIYYVGLVGLWGLGEIAAGFLIIGIPAIPKVTKSIPISASVVSLLHSWTRPSGSGGRVPSSWRSWGKPPTRKRRGQWDITDLETLDLVSVNVTGQRENFSSTNTKIDTARDSGDAEQNVSH